MLTQTLKEFKNKIITKADEEFHINIVGNSTEEDTEVESVLEEMARAYYIAGLNSGLDAMIFLINYLIANGDIKIMRDVVIQRDTERLN